MMKLMTSAVLFLLLGTSTAIAQPASLKAGHRVRLTTVTEPSPITGRIVSADDSAVTVLLDHSTFPVERTLDWNTLTRIELSKGSRSKSAANAWIGAGIGLIAGVGTGAAITGENPPEGGGYAVFILAPLGMCIGALVGAGWKSSESWQALPIDARMGLQLGAPSMPLTVGVQASF